MIYENTLVLYGSGKGAEFMKEEIAEEKKFLDLIATLRSLKEFDPEGYGELEEAMRFIRGDVSLYSLNLFAEYGLMDNPAIQAIMERQQRVLAIVRSNKDIATIGEAMKLVA